MRWKALDMKLLSLKLQKKFGTIKCIGHTNPDLLHSNISKNLEPRRRVLNFIALSQC
jgi:hypothetical protein